MDKLFLETLQQMYIGGQGDPNQIPPLVLAYIGDAIHNLYVRQYLVSQSPSNVNQLHKLSVSFVSAHSQSKLIHHIYAHLTEREQYIIKRGRNAKSGSIPKNADVTEYKYATGFETLIGYLYYNQEFDRLLEILKRSVSETGDTHET